MYGNLDQFLDNLLGAPARVAHRRYVARLAIRSAPAGLALRATAPHRWRRRKKIPRGDCGHCTALFGHRIFAAQTYTITNLKNIPL